jgi:hypothetical protein
VLGICLPAAGQRCAAVAAVLGNGLAEALEPLPQQKNGADGLV